MRKFFLVISLLCSFITRTLVDVGVHPLLSRITIGDIAGGIAILLSVPVLFKQLKSYKTIDTIFIGSAVMIVCFFIPFSFSLNPQATLIECFIVIYLLLLGWVTFITFKDSLLTELLPLLMMIVIIATIIGVYDVVATQYGFHRIFSGFKKYPGVMISGFRNSGQAGSYILIMLTILLPLKFSEVYKKFTPSVKKLTNSSLVLGIVFLHLTGKYSAIIGFLVGVVLFLMFNFRNIKVLKSFGLMTIFLITFTVILKFTIPNSYEKIVYKFDNRIGAIVSPQNKSSEKTENFIVSNLTAGINAFIERPITGTGIGAFQGEYHTHEIHSTYIKILGETGILGLIGYGFFIFLFFNTLRKIYFSDAIEYKGYIKALIPFLIGCFVCWSYTYHLRKREFWILIAVIAIIHCLISNPHNTRRVAKL